MARRRGSGDGLRVAAMTLPRTKKQWIYSTSLASLFVVFIGGLFLPSPLRPLLSQTAYLLSESSTKAAVASSPGSRARDAIADPLSATVPPNVIDDDSSAYESGGGESGNKTLVFLLSHGRSGSTLAESLFFATTNVFFLDEPLKPNEGKARGPKRLKEAMDMLSRCRYPDASSSVATEFYMWERKRLRRFDRVPSWIYLSSELPEATGAEKPTFGNLRVSEAEEVDELAAKMSTECNRSSVTAMKEIRLTHSGKFNDSFSYIRMLLSEHENAKVIHLIRHPHEVNESAGKLEWAGIGFSIQHLCTSTTRDTEVGGDWAEGGRYMRVAYEDMVTDPLAITRQVHAFMGVNYVADDAFVPDTGRAITSEGLVRAAIELAYSDDGPSVGSTSIANRTAKMESYGITRKKVTCAVCDKSVEDGMAEKAPCNALLKKIPLKCCK